MSHPGSLVFWQPFATMVYIILYGALEAGHAGQLVFMPVVMFGLSACRLLQLPGL